MREICPKKQNICSECQNVWDIEIREIFFHLDNCVMTSKFARDIKQFENEYSRVVSVLPMVFEFGFRSEIKDFLIWDCALFKAALPGPIFQKVPNPTEPEKSDMTSYVGGYCQIFTDVTFNYRSKILVKCTCLYEVKPCFVF